MKKMMRRLCLVLALAAVALFVRTTPAAADEPRPGQMDRLERLEKRVNEMAERQEQFMRRLGAQMEHQGAMGQSGHDNVRPQPQPPGMHDAPRPPQDAHAKTAKGLNDLFRLLGLIGIICNILLAIWIFTDIRKRGEGSGIFVAMALVAGIPAAIIYALTRIGDKKA